MLNFDPCPFILSGKNANLFSNSENLSKMTGEKNEFSINNGDYLDWVICVEDILTENTECEQKSIENQKVSAAEKEAEPKLKAVVNRVIKKLKCITIGIFIDNYLPDPDQMPIDGMNNFVLKEPYSSTIYQDFAPPEDYLPGPLSNKGFCLLYKDSKTNHRKVAEISDEFSCSGLFEWFTCYNLMASSAQIIIFDINLPIVKAFHFLLQSDSRAAPIWDNDQNKFIAMLTITDFIKFLHKYYIKDSKKLDNLKNNTIKDFLNVLIEGETNFFHIYPECNLKHGILTISKNEIHRLPILDPTNGNILCIITNYQIFRFFYQKYTQLNFKSLTFMSKTPTELGLGKFNDSIATIHPWESVYNVFGIFIKNHVSVLPVVDENNKLIDVYARYDVVALAEANKYTNLDCTISEVLKIRKLTRPPCICKKEYSLGKIMDIIYEAQVHRVFIVDDDQQILGVISLSDILAFLCDT